MSKPANRFWLCIPPFLMCTLDQGLTLWGQSSIYWAGHYEQAWEGNDLFNWLLRHHPLAFSEAGIVAWVAVFCTAIVLMPRRAAMAVSIAIVLGHAWGASTWLIERVPGGYWLAIALFLATGIIIVATWERFGQGTGKSS